MEGENCKDCGKSKVIERVIERVKEMREKGKMKELGGASEVRAWRVEW